MFSVNNKDMGPKRLSTWIKRVKHMSLSLILSMFHTLFGVCIVDFQQVNASMVRAKDVIFGSVF